MRICPDNEQLSLVERNTSKLTARLLRKEIFAKYLGERRETRGLSIRDAHKKHLSIFRHCHKNALGSKEATLDLRGMMYGPDDFASALLRRCQCRRSVDELVTDGENDKGAQIDDVAIGPNGASSVSKSHSHEFVLRFIAGE